MTDMTNDHRHVDDHADDESRSRALEYDAELEADVLIGRIIDGEATDLDYTDFDALAAAEPSLWRQLAERQRDTARLTEAVGDIVDEAGPMTLPRPAIRRLTWPLALSGWAALIVIALTWAARTPPVVSPSATLTNAPESPVQHYQQYVNAPFVLDELPPVVMNVEALSDGRFAVSFVRRIEEVVFLDPDSELPINEFGELTKDIAQLRAREAGPRGGKSRN